jgi:LacI family transcriptional regulator
VPCVVTDDVEGGRIATRHLVALGHRDIAFIGDESDNGFGFTSSARREQGYEEVLRSAGVRLRRSFVRHGPHERDTAIRLTTQLLKLRTPPTAIFAASDVQATGVLEAARAHGLRVPEDLSVIGFDDIELSAYVGLTTVRQPLFDSGYLGARHLLDALEGRTHMVAAEHHLPLELIVRSTTTHPRSGARG